MSATRLLVLGLVRAYGRAHGYLIHGDLSSWRADEWANVKWGSIYHSLKQLAKEGKLHCIESNGWPWRVDYEMTEKGDAEFFRLLRDALKHPKPRPDMLAAGLALMNALPRDEVIALLKKRLDALEAERAELGGWEEAVDEAVDGDGRGDAPEHVSELARLWVHSAKSGADWTRGLIERLEGGAYTMAGEGAEDACPPDPA